MIRRSVTIRVENDTTNCKLINPRFYIDSGECRVPPQDIVKPGAAQQCFFEKKTGSACGAVGVMTYDIATLQDKAVKQLAIMFCVPFSYFGFHNMFALGVFRCGDHVCDYSLHNLMYAGSASEFTRAKASHGKLKHVHGDYIIEGTMSNDLESVIKVQLRTVK